jgi:hypothetical protein
LCDVSEAAEIIQDDGQQLLSALVGLLQASHEGAAEFFIQNF